MVQDYNMIKFLRDIGICGILRTKNALPILVSLYSVVFTFCCCSTAVSHATNRFSIPATLANLHPLTVQSHIFILSFCSFDRRQCRIDVRFNCMLSAGWYVITGQSFGARILTMAYSCPTVSSKYQSSTKNEITVTHFHLKLSRKRNAKYINRIVNLQNWKSFRQS